MPTPREELANLLRDARIKAGYRSHGAFAKRLHKSRPVISKAESPSNPVPSDDVLMGWAELTSADLDLLKDLAERARAHPAQWFMPWEVIEARASVIRWFSLTLMPGLVQAESYARSVLTWGPYRATAEANLRNRLARQAAVLDRAELLVVFLESVLYREVGDAAVMAGQVEHLLEVCTRPNVRVQVVPDIPAVAGALGGAFAIATEESTDVALYTESIIQGGLHTDPDLIASAARVFDALRTEALPWTQTQECLRKAGEHWRS